jgi:serine/threonine protein kinase
MNPSEDNDGPAEKLVGLTLLDSWVVIEKVAFDKGDTGRSRSCCYMAVDDDRRQAFVKAFNFEILDLAGETEELQKQLAEYHNERKIHEHCSNLRRVTRIYGHGHKVIDGKAVHYIVCESGDVSLRRSQPPGDSSIPASERLIALRQVTSALIQLHRLRVAHQDIKPSNVVNFSKDQIVKITDLGSASCSELPSPPHDEEPYVGQVNYVPYELLYSRSVEPNWYRRRIGCDVYLLGNLIFTSFTGVSLTSAVLHGIPESLRHTEFSAEYDEVLPDLITQHDLIVPCFLSETTPEYIRNEIIDLVQRLCHPDPMRRGVGRGVVESDRAFDLQRCEGVLDRLAKKAGIYERRANMDR